MGSVKTSQIEPNNGVDLNLKSGPGGYVYVNGQIITGSGSVIIGPKGDMGRTGSIGDTGATGATGPKGDTGKQGIPGIDGAVLPAGLTWSGTWNGTQSYLKNYVVGYASASWWSKNNIEGKPFPLTPNSPPDIDSINWSLLATQGPVGIQGPTGPQGIQGPTGIGLQGIQGIQGPTGPTIASMVSYYTTNVQDALDAVNNTLSIKKAGSYIITASKSATSYIGGYIYLNNNGAGGIFSANPNGVSSVWSNDYLDLTDLNEGDMVSIRFEIGVTTSIVDQLVSIQLVLAENTASQYSIPLNDIILKNVANNPLSFNTEFCIKNSDYINGKGRIVFSSNGSCDIDMRDIYIKVLLYS